jgi:hypothetical protein
MGALACTVNFCLEYPNESKLIPFLTRSKSEKIVERFVPFTLVNLDLKGHESQLSSFLTHLKTKKITE